MKSLREYAEEYLGPAESEFWKNKPPDQVSQTFGSLEDLIACFGRDLLQHVLSDSEHDFNRDRWMFSDYHKRAEEVLGPCDTSS